MVVRMASSTDKAFRSKGAVVNRQATKEMDVRKTLFDTEGMDAFLDWITVVGHYRQAQHRLVHSHRNVARYIASKHGTRWDPEMVKSALKFVKERYYQAREILTSTDNGGNTETDATLRDKVLTVCPPFEKLDTVFGTPSESLHLPPAQSLPPQPGESSNSRALLSPDMVDLDDISDTDYDDHPSESKTQSHPPRRSKRQNTEKTAVATSSEGGVMTKQDSKERVVWKGGLLNTEGIDMLVDWIRDAGNFEPSTIERSIFRQKKLVDSHRDIARYITSKHGTKWNRQMVGTALHRLRKMYDQAREILTSAGEGGDIETDTLLRDKVLTVCPLFEKLDTVFGTSVEGLHIPPVQTLPLHPREPSNSRALLSPDTADIDDITEVDHDNHPSENETPSHPPRRSKRQKMEKTVVAESSRSTVVNKHASKRDHLKTFFITKGMDVFLNWITDAGNYEPSTSRRTIFGDKRLVHSYGDIAKHINSIHGTNWDQQTVSNRLYRLKAKYDQAKEILTIANGGKNTEDTKLRYRVLAVCPPFEKLRNVFGTPFERLHLPPEQTLPPQHGEPAESRTPLSPSIMDQNRSDDMDSDGQPTEGRTTCTG
ncbi:hypothetical protein B0O80DRAFT_461673 [Mortierella sp. GBAus27b]|nr:hypothetical protein B0O80DRAFT_461673 [Mortierella sp. GBAus27b]